jgi:hypothetical protein
MSTRSWAATPDEYFAEISDAQLVCLAYGHDMPVLFPGQRIPRGVDVVPDMRLSGCMQLTEHCLRSCGVSRISTTLPGNRFDMDMLYQYQYDDKWIVRPEHLTLTPRMFKAELYRRAIWG